MPQNWNWTRIKRGVKRRIYNRAIKAQNFICPKQNRPISEFQPLAEIQKRAAERTDICDHLQDLFALTLSAKPKLIVELGVRGGESTFVFERAAKLIGAKLLSVDMNDCRDVSNWQEWLFVQSDDISFAQKFPAFAKDHGLPASIDLLFIDTSHEYNHTVAEVNSWLPLVSQGGLAAFHDTNLRELYHRRDGSWGLGWDNERGVIRALEGYFGKQFAENSSFVEYAHGWLIRHEPICQGFTVMKKIS